MDQAIELKRIKHLELCNMLLMGLVILLLLKVFLPTFFFDDNSPARTIIQTSALQLKDANNQIRAGLEVIEGVPNFYLTDEKGNKRFIVSHSNEATQLFMNDAQGTTRVGIAQFSHGGGGFALHGEHSKGAAVLYFKEKGSLRFFDEQGKTTNQVLAVPLSEPFEPVKP